MFTSLLLFSVLELFRFISECSARSQLQGLDLSVAGSVPGQAIESKKYFSFKNASSSVMSLLLI